MQQMLDQIIDRVTAWIDRVAGPAPQLIPIPVEKDRKPGLPNRKV